MIYITGDCHADFRKFSTESFPEQQEMTKDDCVIICGDFGGIWDRDTESAREKYWLNWLEEKPYTTLFVDGNHENFERLYQYPLKEWNGGLVHKVRPSVLHLMRGQIFDIDDCSIYAFGGARSHDIDDGVLDEVEDAAILKKWRNDYTKLFRINHVSWWKEEMPSEEEMKLGLENLTRIGNKVDYIVTHDCPASIKALVGHGMYKSDELNRYLDEIRMICEYKKWFFGHLHDDRAVNEKDILLYDQIVRIW